MADGNAEVMSCALRSAVGDDCALRKFAVHELIFLIPQAYMRVYICKCKNTHNVYGTGSTLHLVFETETDMYNINIAFLEEYKKLDALCKDMFGGMDGISEYIRQIEALPESEKMLCRDTKAVYDRLKNLRWIRNCLAHEIGTWDEEICTEADIEWLKNFYDRILAINDPLAFICKVKRARESDRKTPAGSSRNMPEKVVADSGDGNRASLWSRFVKKIKNIFTKR